MCKALKVSRASYYKETKRKNPVDPESHLVEKLFIENKSYGDKNNVQIYYLVIQAILKVLFSFFHYRSLIRNEIMKMQS